MTPPSSGESAANLSRPPCGRPLSVEEYLAEVRLGRVGRLGYAPRCLWSSFAEGLPVGLQIIGPEGEDPDDN